MPPFVASRDKLEAVNRISALAGGGPEELGPGSKERKRVLEKVVTHFELPVDTGRNKVELGRSIAECLGGTWTSLCYSTGYTITLVGLDLILRLAQAEEERRGTGASAPEFSSIDEEAKRILAACAPRFDRELHIRSCVAEMRAREDPNWAQSEWPGFYFEATSRAACMSIEGGEPGPRYGSVRFDYRLRHVWDFKAHSLHMASGRPNSDMILNSATAVEQCVEGEGGLGFIIGHGNATFDADGSEHRWMAAQKASAGIRSRSAASGRSRSLKSRFSMERLDAVFLPDLDSLVAGLEDGWLSADFQAGFRQIDGTSIRKGKYKLHVPLMPADVVVASTDLPTRGT